MHLNELKHYDEDTLVHYGVTGMKWGVRKSRPDGVSRSTNRQARKDAKEFTQAKQFSSRRKYRLGEAILSGNLSPKAYRYRRRREEDHSRNHPSGCR